MSSSECQDEFYWNKTQGRCIECTLGYYGHDCKSHCTAPYYGKGCQKQCVGCANHLCDVSYGCPNYSDVSTFTTQLSKSSILTTWEREKKVFSTKETVSSTSETTTVFQPSLSSLGGVSFYSIKEITSALPTSLGSTTILPSFINSYYPVLLGILGVCFLFLVIFTIYVSLHIHEKCSRKRKLRVVPDEGIETYQEIHELDVLGNFTKYDSLNRRAQLAIPNSLSLAQQGNLMEVSQVIRKEREHDYSEINEKDIIMIESYEAGHSTRNTDLATTESSERIISQQEEAVNIKDHSPPKDTDGYVLPKSGNPTLKNISESDSNARKRESNFRDSTSNDRIYTTDDVSDDYLTVITK